MAISAVNRRLTYERDGNQCVACPQTYGLVIHHRANRQAGGSKLRDHVANYLTACSVHNGQFENVLLGSAREKGWKLRQWENPFAVAVYYPAFGEWRLLDDKGSYTLAKGRDQVQALEGMDF